MKLHKRLLLYLITVILFSIFLGLKFMLFFVFVTYVNALFEKAQFKYAWWFRIEIATFGVIIISYAFNFMLGAATGIISVVLNSIYLRWRRNEDIFIIMMYVVIGLLADYIPLSITLLGILLSLLHFIAMLFFRTAVLRQRVPYRLGRSISNVVFNLIVFGSGTASFIYKLIS